MNSAPRQKIGEHFDDGVVDFSNVHQNDALHVRNMFRGMLDHSDNMPRVMVSEVSPPVSDVYHFTIYNWREKLDDRDWYDTFLSTMHAERTKPVSSSLYRPILTTYTIGVEGDTSGPIKEIEIRKNIQGKEASRAANCVRLCPMVRRGVDFSNIDPRDRGVVRAILNGIFSFESPMPDYTVSIPDAHTKDTYTIRVAGWKKPIDDAQWYDTFLRTKRDHTESPHHGRDTIYDHILNTANYPPMNLGDGEEGMGPPSKLVTVEKITMTPVTAVTDGADTRRRKKKKSTRHRRKR